jgi:hypothetical protein
LLVDIDDRGAVAELLGENARSTGLGIDADR